MDTRTQRIRSSEQSTEVALEINVAAAAGSGPTTLAAFDHALRMTGVANFNLVRLSSVIPPQTSVRAASPPDHEVIDLTDGSDLTGPSSRPAVSEWGHRLYAVWAFEGAELLGQEAWAGVAWVQDPSDGRGVFVEHEGGSEAQVRFELQASLESISKPRGLDKFEFHEVVIGARCEGQPVAALVIAPFMTSGWS